MTLTTQFYTMLSMIGMGAFFGMMLDTYQRLLQRSKRQHWLVFINDILFWAIQALFIFYVLFLTNKGEIRFYIFIALLCGFASYQSLMKRIFLIILEKSISSFISVSHFVKKAVYLFLYKPVRGFLQLVILIILFIGRGLITLVKFLFKVLLLIVGFIWNILRKILFLFWKLLPKGIKNFVEKLYNRLAGNLKRIKNLKFIVKWLDKWKNRNK